MTSRFFQGSDSSSESDEEELYSGSEEEEAQDAKSDDEESDSEESEEAEDDSDDSSEDGAGGASRFLKSGADSSDSESDSGEEVTVVRSAKDKRFEEAENVIKLIDNAIKINDWSVINSEFDKLQRLVPNLTNILEGRNPKIYIKLLADLETTANEAYDKQKVTAKKMSAINQRGLNAVRQKARKLTKDDQLIKDVEKYREDEDAFMKEDVVEEKPKTKARKTVAFDSLDDTAALDEEGFEVVGRDGKALAYTPESILKNLRQITESRGRKGTDRLEQIRVLDRLLEVAKVDYQRIRVLLSLIASRFDTTASTGVALDIQQWKSAQLDVQKLFELLEKNDSIVVVEAAEEWEDDEKLPDIKDGEIFKIPGSVASFAERLDDELTRSLQNIDPHTPEYIERLRDEGALYAVLVRAQLYQEHLSAHPKLDVDKSALNRVIGRRIEHIYFKPSQVVDILESGTWKLIPEELDSKITPRAKVQSADALLQTLCEYLFDTSDNLLRARAMLCRIYWLGLHDRYFEARDDALMSHLSDSISNFDISTMVLFNRALVQVGMAAFRRGLISEAQHTLQDICGSNRQKELLAQGVQLQRYSQITPEQERIEKQRLYPFHMHINLELLETIYLTSSMLLEIPLLAQLGSSAESRRRIISKQFRRLLEYHERAIFTGPPENTRDHVLQAAKALAAGDWRKSADFINAIKIWDLLPQAQQIKDMLRDKIQIEGLRTYLFTYAPFYDTLSVDTLTSMFDLPETKVSAVISKMISNEELPAALDQVTGAIIFRKGVDLSRLQTLALALSDKASGLIESNEKVLEQRTQGMANPFERQGAQRGGRGRGRGGARGGLGNRGGRGQGFQGGALGAIRT